MSRQILKDRNNHTIGYVEVDARGNKRLLSSVFHTLGYYHAQTNVTKDSRHHMVGHGDLLTSLLPKR